MSWFDFIKDLLRPLPETRNKIPASYSVEDFKTDQANDISVHIESTGIAIDKIPALSLRDRALNDNFKTIDEWLTKRDQRAFDIVSQMLNGIEKERPIVFISYSHDSNRHKRWVWSLAERLRKEGIEVLLDQYLVHGTNFVHFMNFGLKLAYKIIVIGTPGYKQKCTDSSCGVGYEETVISHHILSHIHTCRILPCHRKGQFRDAFPQEIAKCYGFDFTTAKSYENSFPILVRAIWDSECIVKSPLGEKPDFNK